MAKIYIALEWFRAWKHRWRNFVGRQSVGHAWMVQSKALPARTLLLWDWKSCKSAVRSENRRYRVVGSIWWVIPSLITSPLRSPFVSISDHLAGHRIPVRGASVSALLSTGQIFQDTLQAQDPADKDVVSNARSILSRRETNPYLDYIFGKRSQYCEGQEIFRNWLQ